MRKLNENEMTNTLAAGCGWLKKLAKEASGKEQLELVDDWLRCKGKA